MTHVEAREPQQDRSRATRARLLEAAIDCLAEHGWTATTVAVVAERAGVSRGAAQHHFPTREDLFTAAVEHMAVIRAAQVKHELGDSADPAAVIAHVMELFSGKFFRAALIMWVAAANEPELRARIVPIEAKIGREMHLMLVDALGVDETQPGVRESVQATLDLARGLGLANVLTDDSRRRQRISAHWAALLASTLREPA